MAIKRTFQDYPSEDVNKADQRSYLETLARIRDTGWDDLLRSKRILIISEAGAGKTHECREQQKALWKKGEAAFYLELSELAKRDLRQILTKEQEVRLNTWIASQSDSATFFLDSIDELNISKGSFRQALIYLRKGIAEQSDRARIVITTRPTSFDINLVHEIFPIPQHADVESSGEMFAQIAMNGIADKQNGRNKEQTPSELRTVALLPLSDKQIIEFARDQNIDNPYELLEALKKNNAEEFARRPQDLIELCGDWKSSNRIRTHKEQVLTNILTKLKPREDRQERAPLSVDKALDGASRLALAMLVTRRFTIRHDAAKDTHGEDSAIDPTIILSGWNPEEIKVLLERPLFGFANYGRVRFHHRSVSEYLAAQRLLQMRNEGMTSRTRQHLLFAETKGKTIVRPSKRAVAGWLALEDDMIFSKLRDHEPAVLLSEGDPESLTTSQRNEALRAYVERYGNGGWRGLEIPEIQIHRFASPDLASEIIRLWSVGIENDEVRKLLLDMIGMGGITECSGIAHETARNKSASNGERLSAIKALSQFDDTRLDVIATEIADKANTLPDTIVRGVLFLLFPKHLTVMQFCKILAGIKVRGIDSLRWYLPHLIAEADLSETLLSDLRDQLCDLLSVGLRWRDDNPHITSDQAHFSGALAALCIRGLRRGQASEWLRPSVLAIQLHHSQSDNDEVFKQLREILEALPEKQREELFWVEDSLHKSVHPTDDPFDRWYAITLRLDYVRDKSWIESELADTARSLNDRALLLETAIRSTARQENRYELIAGLKPLVADWLELLTMFDDRCVKLSKNDQELRLWAIEDAKRKKKQERKDKKAFASWVTFWHEVSGQLDTVFSAEKSENTAWNLWHVMSQAGNEHWNRRFIETQFDKETADRLRLALMKQWRNDLPTLPSERPDDKRGTTLVRWRQGLAGLYAEAEDPQWATRLTEDEARLAARYVLLELNSLPLWLDTLVSVHPAAVDAILGEELSWELNCTAEAQWHSMLLQSIGYASNIVIQAFLPRLWSWFQANHKVICKDENNDGEIQRLDTVVEMLVRHGVTEIQFQLHTIAKKNLRKQIPFSLAAIWLPALMRLAAKAGVDELETRIEPIAPAPYSEAVIWFSTLFWESRNGMNLTDSQQFSPEILLRLLRLVYRHVRPADDIEHDGAYSPDVRDNAERVRNTILMALLNAKGEDAWRAKLDVVDDQLFREMKDRIQVIAEDRWAEEIDTDCYNDDQAKELDTKHEAPPSTNEAMFNVMVGRLEDINEMLLRDDSLLAIWALIKEETLMRRAFAHELGNKSNGIYKPNQEAVTGDEKETDIRLCSRISNHEAVIELKLAEKYSARELLDALHNQLVRKYMKPDNRRSGCLLLTLSKEKKWKHPDDGSLIDFDTLIQLLQDEAKRIMKSMGGLRVYVHALDLRPRLPIEKKKSKKRA